ncbi:type 4 pilus major pilin [Aeromonas veronii]|uniref:type 4 pilus major pilin n=1 Tax=Aeromonas TaxID=642 RepID=UPI00315928CB
MNRNFNGIKSIKKNGFTLIELLVVLAIFAVLYIAFGDKVNNTFASNDNQTEVDNITMMITGAKGLKSTVGYPDANMVPALIDIKQVPSSMTITGTAAARKIFNQWGGEVSIAGAQTDKTTYLVTDRSVPKDACIRMVSSMTKGGLIKSTNINAKGARLGEVTTVQSSADCDQDTNNTIAYIIQG